MSTLISRLLEIDNKDEINYRHALKTSTLTELHKNTVKIKANINKNICQIHIYLLIVIDAKKQHKANSYKIIIRKFKKSKHIYKNADFIAFFDLTNLRLSTKYYDDDIMLVHTQWSYVACNNKSFFVRLDNNFDEKVQSANEKDLDVKSCGTVQLTLKANGQIKTVDLLNTLYVPELRYNPTSTGKPTNYGCRVIIKKCFAVIIGYNEIPIKARKRNELHIVDTYKTSNKPQIVQNFISLV